MCEEIEDKGFRFSKKKACRFSFYQEKLRRERKDFFEFFASLLVDEGLLEWGEYEIIPTPGFAGERRLNCKKLTLLFRSYVHSHHRTVLTGTQILLLRFPNDPHQKSRVITLPSDLTRMFEPEIYCIYTQWMRMQIQWGRDNIEIPEESVADDRLADAWQIETESKKETE